jgi:hypothetical protein
MAILASVRRSAASLESHGMNVKVLLHTSDNQKTEAIIQTNKDYLLIYGVIISSHEAESRYKLDTSRAGSSNRRRSFAGPTEPDSFPPYSLKYRRTIKVDSRLSWYSILLHS